MRVIFSKNKIKYKYVTFNFVDAYVGVTVGKGGELEWWFVTLWVADLEIKFPFLQHTVKYVQLYMYLGTGIAQALWFAVL